MGGYRQWTNIWFAVRSCNNFNFIFITHKTIYAETLYKELKNRGVLVRYFNKERIDNYLRVTIGTDEEIEMFIEKIKEIVL